MIWFFKSLIFSCLIPSSTWLKYKYHYVLGSLDLFSSSFGLGLLFRVHIHAHISIAQSQQSCYTFSYDWLTSCVREKILVAVIPLSSPSTWSSLLDNPSATVFLSSFVLHGIAQSQQSCYTLPCMTGLLLTSVKKLWLL